MKTIPYAVKLDISKMSTDISKTLDDAEKARLALKQSNMEKLIPHVAEFVHYLVDINNQAITGGSYGGNDHVRLLGINNGKLIHSEIINKKIQECYFSYDGSCWQIHNIGSKGFSIWLNKRQGAHVSTPYLPYSMTGYDSTYGESVAKVAQEILVATLKISK